MGAADTPYVVHAQIETDELLALWRAHHVQMVERRIGTKPGTGGSEGVAYLQTMLPKRAFPDLWGVRTHLGRDPQEGSAAIGNRP